jgi:hypothetical protein
VKLKEAPTMLIHRLDTLPPADPALEVRRFDDRQVLVREIETRSWWLVSTGGRDGGQVMCHCGHCLPGQPCRHEMAATRVVMLERPARWSERAERGRQAA